MARLGSIKLKLDRALELFTTSFKTLSTQLEKKADKEVVESLSTKLSHVQLEVDELKSSQQHAVDKRLDSYVSELEAREDRKHNIIAFNIDESDSADGMTRKTEDMEQVNKILSQIDASPREITDCRRLGPYNRERAANKPRPLRLSVGTLHQRDNVLKAARKLKDTAETKDVIIRKDLTPLQEEKT